MASSSRNNNNVLVLLLVIAAVASLVFTWKSISYFLVVAPPSSSSVSRKSAAVAMRKDGVREKIMTTRVSKKPHSSSSSPSLFCPIIISGVSSSSSSSTKTRSSAGGGGGGACGAALRVLDPPRFSDFPAYQWPNASQLLAENRLVSILTTKKRRGGGSGGEDGSNNNDDNTRGASLRSRSLLRTRPENEEADIARKLVSDFVCPSSSSSSPSVAGKTSSSSSSVVKLYVPWKSFSYMTPHPLSCSSTHCELTNAKADIPTVDGYVVDTNGALVNEAYDWVSNPLNKVLVLFNTENIEGRRVALKKGYGIRYLAKPWNSSFWNNFHIVASYQTESHVVVSFLHWALCRDTSFVAGFRFWERAVVNNKLRRNKKRPRFAASGDGDDRSDDGNTFRGKLAAKNPSAAPVLFFVRNCDFASHRRAGFMRRLQQHIAIDSVGKCENNKAQESVRICSGLVTNRRSCIIADYKFYLAIENSISLDYVSEKVYEALLVGTIPVYLGAPNAADFMPAKHSAIFARDFSSQRQLAAYLKCVMKNRTLYEYYTSWYRRPLLPLFKKLASLEAPLCQVCEKIRRVKNDLLRHRGAASPPSSFVVAKEKMLLDAFSEAKWRNRRVPGVAAEVSGDAVSAQAPLSECLL